MLAAQAKQLASLTGGRKRISIPEWVRLLVQGGTELLVLAQLAYYHRRKVTGRMKGELWHDGRVVIVMTYRELGDDINREPGAVRQAVRRLIEAGLIKIEQHRSRYHSFQKATHFFLREEKILRAINDVTFARNVARDQGEGKRTLPSANAVAVEDEMSG